MKRNERTRDGRKGVGKKKDQIEWGEGGKGGEGEEWRFKIGGDGVKQRGRTEHEKVGGMEKRGGEGDEGDTKPEGNRAGGVAEHIKVERRECP